MAKQGSGGHDFALDRGQGPEDFTVLGRSLEDGSPVGYYQQDRVFHTQVLGMAGSGKSTLLENIALQDMQAGRGGLFLDPHGDSAERLAAAAPAEAVRHGRVAYLDFGAEQDGLVALNPFEVADVTSEESRQDTVDRALDLLERAVGLGDSASRPGDSAPRIVKYIGKALRTLAFLPEAGGSVRGGATLMDLMPLYRDAAFREYAMGYVTDESLKSWWSMVFGGMQGSKAVGEMAALENRLGPVLNDSRLVAVLSEPRSTLDIAKAMDAGIYVIVSMGKARNSGVFRRLVGSSLVSQAIVAALGRHGRVPEADRRRFHLVLDEFHHFLTNEFWPAMEEARKYGLSLTVAHQSMGQLEGHPEIVRALGYNAQNRIAYGVGPADAAYLADFMAPFTAADLVGLPSFHAGVKLRQAGGRGVPGFEIVTLPPQADGDGDNGLLPLRPGDSVGPLYGRYVPVPDGPEAERDSVVL